MNRKNGLAYEIYINNYLNNQDHIKISYLWKNVPDYILYDYGFINSYDEIRNERKNNTLQDIGTDILYITKDNKCVIVQCKNYSNNIKVEDLAGFFLIMHQHEDKLGEVYYTSDISHIIKNKYTKNRLKFIRKEFQIENNIISNIQLYDYQKNIIDISNYFYQNNNSGIISMPCGTGKTLIGYNIASNYSIIMFITPLKQYAKQNIYRVKEYDNNRKSLLIDSDGTRNIDIIKEFINNNEKVFLSITYKSCDIIIDLLDEYQNIFIIFDEFHNFSYCNIFNDNDYINKIIKNNYHNKLYLSATPRIYELEDKKDIDINDLFGNYIYKMNFCEAINNKYISNYEIYMPIFDESLDKMDIEKEINENIDEEYLLKITFFIEAIKKFGNLKTIVYVKSHIEVDNFIDNFNKINKYYNYDVYINKITCNTTCNNRNKILEEFNNSTKISLLLSVYILDEAIDIKSCDSIFMTYITDSKIRNVQRISRAMRYKDNKIAKILLYSPKVNESINFMSSIKEYDTSFIDKIKYINITDKIKEKKEREQKDKEYIKKNSSKILGIKIYQEVNWDKNLEKLSYYLDKYNKLPSYNSNNNKYKNLRLWYNDQLNLFNNEYNLDDKFIIWNKFIKKYREYIFNKNRWIKILNMIIEYIDINNKLPSIYDYYLLNKWLNDQIIYYKNRYNIMKCLDIYNKFTLFLLNDKYKHFFNIDTKFIFKSLKNINNLIINIKKYIDKNKIENNIINNINHKSKYNILNFENNKIIVLIDNDNKIWFNAKQICILLEYKQAKQAIINNVEKNNKIQLKNMNINFKIRQQPDSIYINEEGLQSLLISSRTNKSKIIMKWITKNILSKLNN